MKKNYLWLFLVVAGVLSIPARANNYTVNFTGTEEVIPTPVSFTYVEGTGFSNFHVDWFGVGFDFTSAANGASGCGTSGPALAFALLEQALTACPPGGTYMWEGQAFGDGGQTFDFSYGPPGGAANLSLSGIPNCPNPSNNCATTRASGSWTVSSPNSVPEPSTFMMLGAGLLPVIGVIRRRYLNR